MKRIVILITEKHLTRGIRAMKLSPRNASACALAQAAGDVFGSDFLECYGGAVFTHEAHYKPSSKHSARKAQMLVSAFDDGDYAAVGAMLPIKTYWVEQVVRT